MGTSFTAGNPAMRAQRVRSFLQKNQLRAWIAWRPEELLMLSGYFPYWGVSLLICFADAEPVLFVPQIEPRDHIPSGLTVRDYPWGDLRCSDPYSVLVASVEDELGKAGARPEQVGMTAAASRSALPIQAAEQIPLPENFANRFSAIAAKKEEHCKPSFADLYFRKTSEEIQAIRLANQVANVGLQVFFENLQAGIPEAAVAAKVESAIHQQIGPSGIFHSRGWAMVQSGPNSADSGRFNRSTGRRLVNGDLVLIELATCVNGYWSDLTRTGAVGSPPTASANLLSIVKSAQQSAIDAIRDGVSAAEIDAVARNKIAGEGLSAFFTHHTGHHVGFRYHDPGFLIAPGVNAKLEAGMVVTIEPGVYVQERGAGARMEDNVLVTETGHEVLSRMETDDKP
jgi:Xaa-Pro dipeptidase